MWIFGVNQLLGLILSITFFFVYFCLFYFFFYSVISGTFFIEYYLFRILGVDVGFTFIFDFISLGFSGCVSFISGVVFVYRTFYMAGTVDFRRFYLLVLLFVLSMFILVFSGNFFLTMLGWDGLGLVSFCLVIFYSNSASLESGLVTVLSNRIGDVFFLCSFFFIFSLGTFSWDLSSFVFFKGLGFLLLLGALTKRAQLPFRAWLPAAMAAPTPVSSLVHSSTLVTAGVYVLIRYNYIFYFLNTYFFSVLFLITMVLAGLSARLESDLKKIVAISTLSQLGIIIFVLSVGGWVLSFIHMVIHAFFKSILFLRTGSMISQKGGTQDSRFYGTLNYSFGSFLYFVVRSFCLSGFPFLIGFYSKDFIISSFSLEIGSFLFILFIVGCFLTVSYSMRLLVEGYRFILKYVRYFSFYEEIAFFLPVSFLYFKCWLLGGLFYMTFLREFLSYLKSIDLFLGILLIIGGLLLYLLLRFLYSFFVVLSMILYIRWFSTSGSSFTSRGLVYSKFELSWIELVGGGGVFLSLNKINKSFFFYKNIGVRWIIILLLYFGFYLI